MFLAAIILLSGVIGIPAYGKTFINMLCLLLP